MTYSSKELELQRINPWALQVRRWRRKHKLTQAEFCAMIDPPPNVAHWGMIERGKRNAGRGLMERVDVLILRWSGK